MAIFGILIPANLLLKSILGTFMTLSLFAQCSPVFLGRLHNYPMIHLLHLLKV